MGYYLPILKERLLSLFRIVSTFAKAEEVDTILVCEAGDTDHLKSLLMSESGVCLLVVATEDEYQGPTVIVDFVSHKIYFMRIMGYYIYDSVSYISYMRRVVACVGESTVLGRVQRACDACFLDSGPRRKSWKKRILFLCEMKSSTPLVKTGGTPGAGLEPGVLWGGSHTYTGTLYFGYHKVCIFGVCGVF